MAIDAPPEPTTFLGQISAGFVYAISLVGLVVGAAWQILSQRKVKREEPHVVSTTIEMVDTSTLAKGMRDMMERSEIRDERILEIGRKIDDCIERLRRIENEAEITRRARAEVAVELARERSGDHR